MVTTDRDDLMERMRLMHLHGMSKDAWKRYTQAGSWSYEILAPGFKYNLTDIAAAIGVHQLRKAEDFRRRRLAIADAYDAALGGLPGVNLPRWTTARGTVAPVCDPGGSRAAHHRP
jgi:dTDP-4-amino-4,6-dideoxygalactose transaminase